MIRKSGQRLGHAIDGVGELGDFAFRLDKQLLLQVAVGDRCNNSRDTTHLIRQVPRHEVHAVGQIFPSASDSLDRSLSSKFPVGADFPCDTRHLRREGVELVHHRVHRIFQLKNFALHVHRDLLR